MRHWSINRAKAGLSTDLIRFQEEYSPSDDDVQSSGENETFCSSQTFAGVKKSSLSGLLVGPLGESG